MKILVMGNRGYIGAVLVEMLLERSYEVVGYDIDYYDGCELYEFNQPVKQIRKDIRDVGIEDLAGIDAVIHLAALSNDPLGEFSPKLTEDINLRSTLKLAGFSRQVGVKRFIYSMLPFIVFFAGCANPYSKFYKDYTGGINIAENPDVIMPTGRPKLIQGSNIESDSIQMAENGYFLLGESNFNAGPINQNSAIDYARKV